VGQILAASDAPVTVSGVPDARSSLLRMSGAPADLDVGRRLPHGHKSAGLRLRGRLAFRFVPMIKFKKEKQR